LTVWKQGQTAFHANIFLTTFFFFLPLPLEKKVKAMRTAGSNAELAIGCLID
jgi:hypothetical protein